MLCREIFYSSLLRLARQKQSTKLAQHAVGTNHAHYCHTKSYQFGQIKCQTMCRAKETDLLVHRKRKDSMITSTSSSKETREQQQQLQEQSMNVTITKQTEGVQKPVSEIPILLRRYTTGTMTPSNKRMLWRIKSQITL